MGGDQGKRKLSNSRLLRRIRFQTQEDILKQTDEDGEFVDIPPGAEYDEEVDERE
jgi:hypothetical protein